jgi:signal transduction histidine kinase
MEIDSKQKKVNQSYFKPKARLLLLLGDQLIREPGIAVFELVKNSYDADSPWAKITMEGIEKPETGKIIIEDAGTGMDMQIINDIWLEPGTDYRKKQKDLSDRTPIYHRLPLGEKGVGRFAAHKLGRNISLVSRVKNHLEVFVEINWNNFDREDYLSNVPVKIIERDPLIFLGKDTGTRIEITNLWEAWDRKMVRNLARSINSICSPFDRSGDFSIQFLLPQNQSWLKGLLTVPEIMEHALFKAHCQINTKNNELSYVYQFIPYSAMRELSGREYKFKGEIPQKMRPEIIKKEIGDFSIDLSIFDREPAVLQLGVTDRKGLTQFLNDNGGIRVYRDNIRVYDYGEPDNDWLNLDAKRVNIPAKRISNNIVIGAVSLSLATSKGLIEKTNREGFVENQASQTLREAVEYVIKQIEIERNKDKDRIRNVYGRSKTIKDRQPVLDEIDELRQEIQKRGLEKELGSMIDRIEGDFILIRDRFISSASTGLSLSVVIHEVEKGIDELEDAVKNEPVSEKILQLTKHLADLVEGFAALIRKSGRGKENAKDLIKNAIFNTSLRLKLHGISLEIDNNLEGFEVICSRRLVISTLMNLIDNSIWWLDNKWGEISSKKKIYIGTSRLLGGNPAIIVADNGPGFIDSPEDLVEPFFSRKPDGMGLGLHIADQVMKAQGGQLEFPVKEVLLLPEDYTGAIVALVFQEDVH